MARTKMDGVSRVERARRARKLSDQGYTQEQVAKFLGVSRSYASSLLNDPDGSKDRARKEKYRGVCIDCGGPTTHTKKKGQAGPHRCSECAKKRIHKTRKWTRERMIADIRRWNEIYGEPPKAQEWLYYVSENNDREWPHVALLQQEFGSWSNALEAAGFERRVNYERTDEWKASVTDWPEDVILEKLREWADLYGQAPRGKDWMGHGGKNWPSQTTVIKKFGSWRAAVEAAGLRPRMKGRKVKHAALVEFEADLLYPMNGEHKTIPIPSFTDRGEGRGLLDVVRDLQKGR